MLCVRCRGIISFFPRCPLQLSDEKRTRPFNKNTGVRDGIAFTSTLAGDAVLVHVQRVEHMRVAILPLTAGDRRVEVESCTFSRWRAKLAVLLQLKGAKQRVVSEIHGRRLFRVCGEKNIRRFYVTFVSRLSSRVVAEKTSRMKIT